MVALLAAPDEYLEEVLAATRDAQPLPAPPPPASAPPASKIPVRARYLFSLEQAEGRAYYAALVAPQLASLASWG